MSKSLGNSPDPIELMQQYGADGVRVGMLLTSPAGNDLPFDESLCEQGRNFSNKIWNAFRLVKGWEVSETAAQPDHAAASIRWFEARSEQVLADIEQSFAEFRLSEALMATYKHIWDDFCSWYLELAKPTYGEPCDRATYDATVRLFERMLSLLHPFMPFLTEEVYSLLQERPKGTLMCTAPFPTRSGDAVDGQLLADFDQTTRIVAEVRGIRQKGHIPNKQALDLKVIVDTDGKPYPAALESVVCHLCNVTGVERVEEKVTGAFGFVVETHEFFIPAGDAVDLEAEKDKIRKDLEYQQGFLNIVRKKLSNEKFVNGAPEQVVASERAKEADAVAKIEVLQAQLDALG